MKEMKGAFSLNNLLVGTVPRPDLHVSAGIGTHDQLWP